MRIKKIWLTIILICCSILFFVACKEERVAENISLIGYSSETPLEFKMGKFSYKNYEVTITYNDGETETLALTEDMIPETDKLKFYQEGRNSITITYKGAETSIEINALRNEFSQNVQLQGITQTYNGQEFTVKVEGDLPGGTNIIYPQGNTFKNAGSYDMTAILQCEGYVTKTLSAKVNIEKATYDVTKAQLYAQTVVYDKEMHSLAVKGTPFEGEDGKVFYNAVSLPQGVSVSYSITKIKDGKGGDISKVQSVEGNKAVDAGTYEVRAHFKGDASNYYAIPDSVAHLTIKPAEYDLSQVEFLDKTATYSGEKHALKIAENSKLPLDVVVSYQMKQLKDGAGETVRDTYKDGNIAIDAGVYLVKANFSVNGKNADNYTTKPFEKEAYLTIERAVYDISNVEFFDTAVVYTGKPYEVKISSELPKDIEVSYKIEQVKDGAGVNVSGENKYQADTNIATDAGEYLVTANLYISNEEVARNYTVKPYEKKATLTILRASYDQEIQDVQLQGQWFNFEEDKTYEILIDYELPDGVTPQFTLTSKNGEIIQGKMETVVDETTGKTTYKYLFTTETAGEYTCVVAFVHDNTNYETITLTLTAEVYIDNVA